MREREREREREVQNKCTNTDSTVQYKEKVSSRFFGDVVESTAQSYLYSCTSTVPLTLLLSLILPGVSVSVSVSVRVRFLIISFTCSFVFFI